MRLAFADIAGQTCFHSSFPAGDLLIANWLVRSLVVIDVQPAVRLAEMPA